MPICVIEESEAAGHISTDEVPLDGLVTRPVHVDVELVGAADLAVAADDIAGTTAVPPIVSLLVCSRRMPYSPLASAVEPARSVPIRFPSTKLPLVLSRSTPVSPLPLKRLPAAVPGAVVRPPMVLREAPL